jgi:hypothetical protein
MAHVRLLIVEPVDKGSDRVTGRSVRSIGIQIGEATVLCISVVTQMLLQAGVTQRAHVAIWVFV